MDARDIYEHPHTKNGPSRKKKTKKTKKKRESVAYIYITHTRRFFAGREFCLGFFVALWSAEASRPKRPGKKKTHLFVRSLPCGVDTFVYPEERRRRRRKNNQSLLTNERDDDDEREHQHQHRHHREEEEQEGGKERDESD